jgi:hypothetical protein
MEKKGMGGKTYQFYKDLKERESLTPCRLGECFSISKGQSVRKHSPEVRPERWQRVFYEVLRHLEFVYGTVGRH